MPTTIAFPSAAVEGPCGVLVDDIRASLRAQEGAGLAAGGMIRVTRASRRNAVTIRDGMAAGE